MKRFHCLTLITLIAVVATAAAAQAQDAPGRAPEARHGHAVGPGAEAGTALPWMEERLKLTDDQKKRVEDIRFSHQKKSITMRAEVESAHLDLERLLDADPPDQRAINNQIDRLAQLRAGLARDRVAGMLEVRALLTPEQRQEWRTMHRGMHGWGHHGPGMEGGGMNRGMRGRLVPTGPDDSL